MTVRCPLLGRHGVVAVLERTLHEQWGGGVKQQRSGHLKKHCVTGAYVGAEPTAVAGPAPAEAHRARILTFSIRRGNGLLRSCKQKTRQGWSGRQKTHLGSGTDGGIRKGSEDLHNRLLLLSNIINYAVFLLCSLGHL